MFDPQANSAPATQGMPVPYGPPEVRREPSTPLFASPLPKGSVGPADDHPVQQEKPTLLARLSAAAGIKINGRKSSRHRGKADAFHAGEARFHLMADAAPLMVWVRGTDGSLTWANTRWFEFTGRSVEEELGLGWLAGVHPDDRARCSQTYREALEKGNEYELEYRLRSRDGSYRWLRECGAPTRSAADSIGEYIGSCKDVSDRRLVEETLRDRVATRTKELRTANEKLQYEICERRRIESILEMENRILELMATGVNLDILLEAICRSIEGLIPDSLCSIRLCSPQADTASSVEPSRAPPGSINVFGAIAERGIHPSLNAERTVVPNLRPTLDDALNQEGIKTYWLEPILGPGGGLIGTLGVYRTCEAADWPGPAAIAVAETACRLAGIATEGARIEAESRERLSQLAHVTRLTTMGEMASGLAHELNQPLCAIVNYAEACVELVSRDEHSRAKLTQSLAEVARQAERAGKVIQRLRDFVKRSGPERQALDVNAIVRDVVALTDVESRHSDVRVRVKLDRRAPKVFADRIQIEQVVVNLVRNGCQAMRRTQMSSRVLLIETRRLRGNVEVCVSDSGPGVPPELAERLFEPFFTTKHDGMGMGLSISRSIMEEHEGRIWVTSNPLGGATFHLTLPTAWRARHG